MSKVEVTMKAPTPWTITYDNDTEPYREWLMVGPIKIPFSSYQDGAREEAEELAQLIAKAVRSYRPMLEALEAIMAEAVEGDYRGIPVFLDADVRKAVRKCETAIQLAKEEIPKKKAKKKKQLTAF
jgi:hypothetical protein